MLSQIMIKLSYIVILFCHNWVLYLYCLDTNYHDINASIPRVEINRPSSESNHTYNDICIHYDTRMKNNFSNVSI